jgi:K+-transporting ATPase ATPase C chain
MNSLHGIKVIDMILRALLAKHTQTRTLGILGEPRVNVLLLNLDLDHGG